MIDARERIFIIGRDDYVSLLDFVCAAHADEGSESGIEQGCELAISMVADAIITPGLLVEGKFQQWSTTPEESARRITDYVAELLREERKLLPGTPCWFRIPLDSLPPKLLLTRPISTEGVDVHEVNSLKKLQEFFDGLTVNSTDITPSTYPGVLFELPDKKTMMGWRTEANLDPYPAVDIYRIRDGKHSGARLHVNQYAGWNRYDYLMEYAEEDCVDLLCIDASIHKEIGEDIKEILVHGKMMPRLEGVHLLAGDYAAELVTKKILIPGYLWDGFRPWTTTPEESAQRILDFVATLPEEDLLFGQPCWFDLPQNSCNWKEPLHPDNPPWENNNEDDTGAKI